MYSFGYNRRLLNSLLAQHIPPTITESERKNRRSAQSVGAVKAKEVERVVDW